MKIKELRGLSKSDLDERLLSLEKDVMKDSAQVAIGTPPKNPGKLRLAKKSIARIKMLLAQKEDANKV